MKNNQNEFDKENEVINEIDLDELGDVFEEERTDELEALDGAVAAQKKKNSIKKILMIALPVLIVAALLCTAGFFVWKHMEKENQKYIMTYNDEKISVDELKFFMQMRGINERGEGISEMVKYLTVDKTAKEKGIELTEEEKEQIRASLTNYKKNVETQDMEKLNVSDQRLQELITINWYYRRLILDASVDYMLSEEEHKAQLEAFHLNGKMVYLDVELKYVFFQTKNKADEAKARLDEGVDFEKVAKDLGMGYKEEHGVETVQLRETGLDDEITEKLLALKVEEISEVIKISDFYVIFQMERNRVPSDEEIEKLFDELFLNDVEPEIFRNEYPKWSVGVKYTVNQKAYDAMGRQ